MQHEKPKPPAPDSDQEESSARKKSRDYMKYSGMAFQMGITILIGTWAGKKLDEHYQSPKPYFTMVLALLSTFAALYLVLKDFIKR